VHDGEEPAYAGQVTCQLGTNLTLDGSFSPGYVWRGSLNYSKFSFLNMSGSYSRYLDDPFRNKLNQIHNVQLSLSSPLKIGNRYLGLRYNATWDKFLTSDYVNMNYALVWVSVVSNSIIWGNIKWWFPATGMPGN